jgi:carboxyl-terminal processing protease
MLEYMKWGESMEKNIQSKPQPKKGLKKRRIKEILFIVSMIVCLGIGFIFGYIFNSQNNSIIKSSGDTTILDEAYHILKNDWYNPNDTEVNIEGNSIAALVSSLGDIHSSYFTFEESLAFNQSVDGNFDGIGIAFISLNSGILVTEVYPNSPASESNIQVGDIINKVDETDIVGKDSEEVKELVRGEAGTIVKLSGYRNNENFVADVKRGSVETAVNGEIREENGKKFGYITITTFGSSTGDEVKAYLDQFVDAKLNNIVFDLRGNGGGYLVAANDVLNLFIDEGKTMYQMKEKKGAAKKAEATDGPKYNFPNSYILVDGQTASASEVVAGALQEQCNFKLVGSQTYGKGTAQTQKQLSDGSVLKYTYARWMLPSGKWINGEGLTPDYIVENIDTSEISTKTIESDLSFDCVDSNVKSLQKGLKILGYDCKREDGYFSNDTVEALKQFESDNNLTVDGIYQDHDKDILLSEILIFVDEPANDYQYKKLLEIMN